MNEAEYQENRKALVTLGAAAVCLASLMGGSKPDITEAFDFTEQFVAEAEKRLGGKLPLER